MRLAALALQAHDVDSAVARTCLSIRAYATHLGAPAKFHWTVTEALVRLLAAGPLQGERAICWRATTRKRCWPAMRRAPRSLRRTLRRCPHEPQLHHRPAGQRLRRLAHGAAVLRKIGLLVLRPRSAAGYRRYGEAELARLRRLLAYRDAGLPLQTIKALLDGGDQSAAAMPWLDDIARHGAAARPANGAGQPGNGGAAAAGGNGQGKLERAVSRGGDG
ncbi:MerR family transcriptional regulator [Massilia sp. H-1]|nr:MerR family transcriptional regulator [Massilia sp. H-1]